MPDAERPLATFVTFLEKNRCDKALALAKTHARELDARLTKKQVSHFIENPKQATSNADKKRKPRNPNP